MLGLGQDNDKFIVYKQYGKVCCSYKNSKGHLQMALLFIVIDLLNIYGFAKMDVKITTL